MQIILFVLILCAACIFLLTRSRSAMHPDTRSWLKAGGWLGAAILLSRVTRTPFVTLLSALPFVIQKLRHAEQTQVRATGSEMTREEAALILGVDENAPASLVRDAHRKLIAKNHPDAGGSDYLAAKINQARDVLLG